MKIFLLATVLTAFVCVYGLENCPSAEMNAEIEALNKFDFPSSLVMQLLQQRIQDKFGGSWGVVIVDDPNLINDKVHWTIPGNEFCVTVKNGIQYNLFKIDYTPGRDLFSILDYGGESRMKRSAKMMDNNKT